MTSSRRLMSDGCTPGMGWLSSDEHDLCWSRFTVFDVTRLAIPRAAHRKHPSGPGGLQGSGQVALIAVKHPANTRRTDDH